MNSAAVINIVVRYHKIHGRATTLQNISNYSIDFRYHVTNDGIGSFTGTLKAHVRFSDARSSL